MIFGLPGSFSIIYLNRSNQIRSQNHVRSFYARLNDHVSGYLRSSFHSLYRSLEESSSTIHEAHLRGRRLVGKSFQFPDDAEALILRCDGGNDLEEEAVSLKPVTSGGGIVKKLVIWNTDAPSDVNESIQSALLWAKLSGAIKKTD